MTIWTDLMTVPFELSFVEAAGVETRALVAGSGEAVLCLHGISGHLEAYTRIVDSHSRHFEVHAIDMLGHGYTGKPKQPITPAMQAEHVIAYLDRRGIERAHLVGISLGGLVSAWTAITHPDRVGRLTLIDPGGTNPDPVNAARIKDVRLEGVKNPDPEYTHKVLSSLIVDPANVTNELVNVRYRIYHEPEFAENIHNLMVHVEDPQVRQEFFLTDELLGKIDAETLIVWSRKDPYQRLEHAQRVRANVPQSRLVIFEECGHWPPWERADTFAEINIPFLQSGIAVVSEGSV